jgi:hypothetical protein
MNSPKFDYDCECSKCRIPIFSSNDVKIIEISFTFTSFGGRNIDVSDIGTEAK